MLRHIKTFFACLGFLLTLVVIVPPVWYGCWLAPSWSDAHAGVLIVLGGDSVRDGMMGVSSYWRCVYAVDVWHEGGITRVVLSGDPQTTASMRTWIIGQGIPAAAINIERDSGSTRDNALVTAAFIHDLPGPYILLSSDIHMWRAERAFRKAGLTVLPRPAPDAFKRGNDWFDRPRVFLDISSECVKIIYYKWKGWI